MNGQPRRGELGPPPLWLPVQSPGLLVWGFLELHGRALVGGLSPGAEASSDPGCRTRAPKEGVGLAPRDALPTHPTAAPSQAQDGPAASLP